MRIDPANADHLARLYGVAPRAPMASRRQAEPIEPPARAADHAPKPNTAAARLVSAVVPGGIDFRGEAPAPRAASGALAMYRHPAERNAAATGVSAGRLIDALG